MSIQKVFFLFLFIIIINVIILNIDLLEHSCVVPEYLNP
jgi:hypothetical protein